MSRHDKRWYALGAVIAGTVALVVWFGVFREKDPALSPEALSAQERDFVAGRCTRAEAVDRWLLQQSWFYDESFTQSAGAFGQSSFMFFDTESPTTNVEGAFCIDATELKVRYYERQYIPTDISLSKRSVSFGSRLAPLGEDVFSVRELTTRRLVLTFASDGKNHTFYRKN
jgi:hypothetical protein